MPTTTLNRLQVDREALRRAVELMRAEGGDRREQIEGMLRDDPWQEAARFAAYHRQVNSLHLLPWQSPPCHIDADDIEDILAAGDDGIGGQYAAVLLLKRKLVDRLSTKAKVEDGKSVTSSAWPPPWPLGWSTPLQEQSRRW
jgi:hypothetical protein